jgi:hypothetical protein
MMPLCELSLEALEQALDHINDMTAWAGDQSRANPGPGWLPVHEMLSRDWQEVESELASRRPETPDFR